MASHIKVDLPIMQETVGKYDQAKDALNDSITAMKSAVDSVSWTGAAAQAFVEQFNQLYTNLKNSDQIMLDAENDLKQTMDKMQTAEQSATATGQRLEKGSAALPI